MNVAIVQFDNRNDEQLGWMRRLVDINVRYAKKHGYEHFFHRKIPFDVPPYWAKPWVIFDALERGFDMVLWLDSDAVVHDFDRTIESFFEGDELFIYTPDCSIWSEPFNAGAFFVKKEAKHIIEEWMTLYDSTMWNKENEQWHCLGSWAGPAYEQGSFTKHLIPKYEKNLKKIDWRILQNPYPIEETFVIHFAGQFRVVIQMYLLPKMEEEQRLLANRNSKESMEDLFRLMYHHNLWSNNESKSGPGSTLFQTKNIIEELPLLLKKYEIKSILDIPCGDFHWMKKVDLTGIDYIGADIVPEIIADNKAKASYKFEVLDLVHDDLPKVDLILCRDLMFHLPFESIFKALDNISKSGSKYLLATNHTWKRDSNQDIVVGEWRRLNMREEPLNLPPFIDLIVEGNTEGAQEDRCLCLWKLN